MGNGFAAGENSGISRTIAHVLLSSAAVLSGCSLMPAYQTPPLPVAPDYPADAPSTSGRNAAQTGWRDYFADPQLRALIELALAHNRDLRAAIAQVEAARAAYGIQRADAYPAIDLGATGSRARTPADLSLTGQSRVGGQYQAGLYLTRWELDFWGRVRNLNEAARDEFLASDATRRAIELSLVAQVAQTYLSLCELDERIALARQAVASHEESFRIFSRRVAVGSTSKLELTQVETLLTQAQSLVSQLEPFRAAQAHALTQLTGAPAPSVAPTLDDAQLLTELQTGLPSDLLTQRPDIIAAEWQLQAAHANINAARAAFFPRIALTGSLGTASAELDGLFRSGSGAWSFMPSISLPVFDGGRNRSGLEFAQARRDLALAQYEKTVQTAFREVADALSGRHGLEDQVKTQNRTLAAQRERARLAKLRYQNGAATYLEVLDAERGLLAAEQLQVQTRRALLASRVTLYAALGGGGLAGEAAQN